MTPQAASPQPAEPNATGIRDSKITVPQHVVQRAFVTETVVLNLDTGVYYGLNVTAGRMLEVLAETADFGETVKRIVAEYERDAAEIEQDLARLCDDLLQRGLIELK